MSNSTIPKKELECDTPDDNTSDPTSAPSSNIPPQISAENIHLFRNRALTWKNGIECAEVCASNGDEALEKAVRAGRAALVARNNALLDARQAGLKEEAEKEGQVAEKAGDSESGESMGDDDMEEGQADQVSAKGEKDTRQIGVEGIPITENKRDWFPSEQFDPKPHHLAPELLPPPLPSNYVFNDEPLVIRWAGFEPQPRSLK